MSFSQKHAQTQQQRISVVETDGENDTVKIQVERHDENLGWYTANSLEISRPLLPLLEQSLDRIHKQPSSNHSENNVIPFPTLID